MNALAKEIIDTDEPSYGIKEDKASLTRCSARMIPLDVFESESVVATLLAQYAGLTVALTSSDPVKDKLTQYLGVFQLERELYRKPK